MTEPETPCCTYLDHGSKVCACDEHEHSDLHPFGRFIIMDGDLIDPPGRRFINEGRIMGMSIHTDGNGAPGTSIGLAEP